MTALKAKIVNCKKLGIRKDPSITSIYKETIELADNPPIPVYGWDDRKFYKVVTPSGKEGYANVECLEIIGGTNAKQ